MEQKKEENKRKIEMLGDIMPERQAAAFSDNPENVIVTLKRVYENANKNDWYNSDLFVLLNKWMDETLCVLKPKDLYDYGFKHKKTVKNNLLQLLRRTKH